MVFYLGQSIPTVGIVTQLGKKGLKYKAFLTNKVCSVSYRKLESNMMLAKTTPKDKVLGGK